MYNQAGSGMNRGRVGILAAFGGTADMKRHENISHPAIAPIQPQLHHSPMKRLNNLILLSGCVLGLMASQTASAVSFSFTKLTGNNPEDLAGQLNVDVTADATTVSFQFFNNVGISSVISEIYFDDGFLGLPPVITDSDGAGNTVQYVQGATPSDLPGGNLASPPFVADIVFNAEASNPAPHRGVREADQWVTLTFGLGSFADLDHVVAALNDGSLRIGLHMTGIGAGGGSDSYVSVGGGGPEGVPDGGATAALLGLGMLGLGLMGRRQS
jgi:hypothetical protein